jgi:hypothetical protein
MFRPFHISLAQSPILTITLNESWYSYFLMPQKHSPPTGLTALLWPLRFFFRAVRISTQNRAFRRWRRENPSKHFSDYFAEIVKPGLQRGQMHPTLGCSLSSAAFGEAAGKLLNLLIANGLNKDDVCVDYGCGTLRVGIHVIKYLRRGAYWGLDVDEAILEEGRKLIGNAVLTDKAPHLHVISPKSIAKVAAARPKILFSVSVLVHVHPEELKEYFGNILKIIDDSGIALIRARWSCSETVQFSGQSWAHSEIKMRETISSLGGELGITEQKGSWLKDFGIPVRKGMLCLRKARLGYSEHASDA